MNDGSIGVDAAVTQEGPVAARVFEQPQVDFAYENLFLIVRGFGDHTPEGVGEERSAPEFQTRPFNAIAAHVSVLVADAVDCGDVDTVRDCMAALDRLPCVILRFAELGFFCGVPPDCRWIEQQICPLQAR